MQTASRAYRKPIVLLTVLALTGGIAVGYVEIIVVPRQKIADFCQYMKASKIVGRTPQQVIAMYGTPGYDTNIMHDPTLPKSHQQMLYSGPCWDECAIEFVNDKAVRISQFGK